ncbi:uncharacterized protein B0T23DRAFT_426348 [Neurospora hispaniola]|uniref:SnoaL-like domain-containing protein n=1 Tax=Neurospora hispaniola TaxID=588809 RepID=A0AAJ0MTQ3_9PEZI|nr:hypothetical protein B0T23DRAFT_426348 [Neurospora hispaniola]
MVDKPASTVRNEIGAVPTSMQQLAVSNTLILEAPGVDLTPYNKILVGAVLDLFEGKPTLKHLSLWNPDATFVDPITTAQGYNRYAAQWYALAQVLGPVKIQSHEVVSSGNPIEVKLHNRYTLPPINKTQDIHSLVKIWVDGNGKIARVEDRWDGELPDGALNETVFWFAEAVMRKMRSLLDAAFRVYCSAAWWLLPIMAFRKAFAMTIPVIVKVPRTEEEDIQMRAILEGFQNKKEITIL